MNDTGPKPSHKARFSAAASTYEAHASIQTRVADKLLSLLNGVDIPDRILEVGCGTGLLTRRLLDTYPQPRIHALDISELMIRQAGQNVKGGDRVHWVCVDIADYTPSEPFPLVVSSSSVHWCHPLEHAVQSIYSATREQGCFIAAVMLRDTLKELHSARMKVAPHKAPLSRLPTMDDLLHVLEVAQWEIVEHEHRLFSLVYTDARRFLESIHQQGLTGGLVSRADRLLNRSELQQLVRSYDDEYPHPDGGVTATYHVGFFKALKS